MRAVVVVAHPSTESYCHELTRRAVAGLRAAGHDVEVLDLYGLGFRPAMTGDERRAYHSEQPILDPLVASHATIVRRSELLVFVYPTWWAGLPAMLKGWLDRVLVPGVAFDLDPSGGRVRPALGHVRRIVGISTYGSPRSSIRAINDNGRRILTRALRLSCGPRTRRTWLGLYAIDTATEQRRREFAAMVERRLAGVR